VALPFESQGPPLSIPPHPGKWTRSWRKTRLPPPSGPPCPFSVSLFRYIYIITEKGHQTKAPALPQKLSLGGRRGGGEGRRCPLLPGIVRGVARHCPRLPGIVRCCPTFPETARHCPLLPGIVRGCQNYTTPKIILPQNYTKIILPQKLYYP
jgi:hypothetical protein